MCGGQKSDVIGWAVACVQASDFFDFLFTF